MDKSSYRNIIAKGFLLFIGIAIGLGIFFSSRHSKSIHGIQAMYNISKNKISSMVFFSETFDNEYKDTLIIKNDTVIDEISQSLQKFELYSPNHPTPSWIVNLKLTFSNKEHNNIKICIVKNQKDNCCYFDVLKETWFGDLVLGTFLNNDLEPIIKKYYFDNLGKNRAPK